MENNAPLFDSHIHLFRGGYADRYAWANTDEFAHYESLRRVHNIERALVIGYEGSPQFAGNNQYILELAQGHSWIAPLEYFDAEQPPPLSYLADETRSRFEGIALYIMNVEQAAALVHWPLDIFQWLNERRAIISLNVSLEVLPILSELMPGLSGCSILISHLGLPGTYPVAPSQNDVLTRLEPLRRLSEFANVGVKVSAFYAVSEPSHNYPHRSAYPFLNQLKEDFGVNRLFWGSDYSPALEHVSFAQTIDVVSHLDWPEDEVALIMSENLKRILDELNSDA